MQAEIRAGAVVRVRGGVWLIEAVTAYERCAAIRVAGLEHANHGCRCTLLHPFDRLRVLARSSRPRLVPRRALASAVATLAIETTPWESLRSLATADIVLMPHQLEPALTVLRTGAPRILIADEVGLGKTIQAGLIVAELQCRGLAERVLVVTPAGLREQWADELERRFRLEAGIVDAAALRHHRPARHGPNPWLARSIAITSVDFLKQPEILNGIRDVPWDLLFVDEAHGASPSSDRARALAQIARQSRHVVLLTATPHAGDETAFEHLCGIGRLRGDPIVTFRRTRAAVGLARTRRVRTIAVSLRPDEERMLRLVAAYARAVCAEALDQDRDARLVATVLTKRALSSPAALQRSLERRLEIARTEPSPAAQLVLPLFDEDESPDDLDPPHLAGIAGLKDLNAETQWLTALLDATRATVGDHAKLRALLRLIRSTDESLIVFTEYRDTLTHIHRAVRQIASTTMLHGGMTRPDRRAAEGLFRTGAARVLLATDAAGEGLNLQERCRTVVNFELPWNPIRLEQRVGRVDRIGQTRSVRVANIVARGTAEASVLHRLFERLRSIERSIGLSGDVLGRISEPLIQDLVLHEDVERLQPLLDGLVRRQGPPAPASQTAPRTEETDGEVKRACLIRRLRAATNVRIAHHSDILGSLARRGPWIAKRSRRRGRGGVAVMFTTPISDALQRVQETAFAPLFVAPRTTDSGSANPMSVWTGLRAAHGDALERSASRRTVQRLSELRHHVDAYCSAAIARLEAIAAAVRADAGSARMQPGLFDRRAERAKLAGDERTRTLLDRLERTIRSLQSARTLNSGTPRVDVVLISPHLTG